MYKPHSSEIVLAMVTPNSTGGIQGGKCMQIEFSLRLYLPTDWIAKLYQALGPQAFVIYLLAQKSHDDEPGEKQGDDEHKRRGSERKAFTQ